MNKKSRATRSVFSLLPIYIWICEEISIKYCIITYQALEQYTSAININIFPIHKRSSHKNKCTLNALHKNKCGIRIYFIEITHFAEQSSLSSLYCLSCFNAYGCLSVLFSAVHWSNGFALWSPFNFDTLFFFFFCRRRRCCRCCRRCRSLLFMLPSYTQTDVKLHINNKNQVQ